MTITLAEALSIFLFVLLFFAGFFENFGSSQVSVDSVERVVLVGFDLRWLFVSGTTFV